MNSPHKQERHTTDKGKFYSHITDDENSMMYNPTDMHQNPFFGTWSKLLTLNNALNTEL